MEPTLYNVTLSSSQGSTSLKMDTPLTREAIADLMLKFITTCENFDSNGKMNVVFNLKANHVSISTVFD